MSWNNGTAWGFDSGSDAIDWRDLSVCRDEDPEIMWPLPHAYGDIALARNVCSRCPLKVRLECLADGIRVADFESVRGGFTGDERKARHRKGFEPSNYPEPGMLLHTCERCDMPFATTQEHRYVRFCRRCNRTGNSLTAAARAARAEVTA